MSDLTQFSHDRISIDKEKMNEIISQLEKIVGKNDVASDPSQIYAYSMDASIHRELPHVIVRPESAQEVSEILKLANKYIIPVIPRGAGTSLSGHATPWRGGIVLDMMKMNKIKEINIQNLWVVVEPGVVFDDLNRELAKYGFMFPTGPGSGDTCTIGGMVAVNASGIRALKYGATRDFVLAMEVVMPTGEIIRTGSKTLKNSSGYQIAKLMVGSEGTLGVITEITLRIVPIPEAEATILAAFKTTKDAGKAIAAIVKAGLIPAKMDIMGLTTIQAVNKAYDIGLPEVQGLLLIDVDGTKEEVERHLHEIAEICKKMDPVELKMSKDPEERERIWAGRKAVLPSLSRLRKGVVSVSISEDMSVPIAEVAEVLDEFRKLSEKYKGITIGVYGHAGDGNIHTKILFDVTKMKSWKDSFKISEEIYKVVTDHGGTVAGEHGIGFTKAPFLKYEHNDMWVIRKIKDALDPNHILNPMKIGIQGIPETFLEKIRYPVRE